MINNDNMKKSAQISGFILLGISFLIAFVVFVALFAPDNAVPLDELPANLTVYGPQHIYALRRVHDDNPVRFHEVYLAKNFEGLMTVDEVYRDDSDGRILAVFSNPDGRGEAFCMLPDDDRTKGLVAQWQPGETTVRVTGWIHSFYLGDLFIQSCRLP